MRCPICKAPLAEGEDRRCVAGHAWWAANPGPQTQFLASTAFEVLYGGAAGGGKSASLVVDPLRYVENPRFVGIAFRRTYPELEKTLIQESLRVYPLAYPGARYHSTAHLWTFPSGAKIYFGHLANPNDELQYQGPEFQWVGFDELTHFTEPQYTYLISRLRAAAGGLRMRLRGATNPGGPGHEWVLRRFAPWLDRSTEYGDRYRARPGEVLWVTRDEDGVDHFSPTRTTEDAFSRTFIPAFVTDNAQLMKNDPGYRARLNALDPLTRKQLREGDWLARPSRGLLFRRPWFKVVPTSPAGGDASRIRYWDRAASLDGDWTVGTLMASYPDGFGMKYCIEDVVRFRGRPDEVEKTIKRVSNQDGGNVTIGIEQDPGAAGKFEASYYVTRLAGYNVQVNRVSVDKVQRAQPLSAQVEQGNVSVVKADWNTPFFNELEAFPEGGYDDQVDATSGAFSMLVVGVSPSFDQLGSLPTMPGPRM